MNKKYLAEKYLYGIKATGDYLKGSERADLKTIKISVEGDGAIGKTCMLLRLKDDEFPGEYIPTICDNYRKTLIVDNEEIELELCDHAGGEDYDRLRVLTYPKTDVFCLCFSVISYSSYENIKQKWIKLVRYHCPNVPIVIVGTKIDLRYNKEVIEKLEHHNKRYGYPSGTVTYEDGMKIAFECNAITYLECSSLTGENLTDMFIQCARIAMEYDFGLYKENEINQPLKGTWEDLKKQNRIKMDKKHQEKFVLVYGFARLENINLPQDIMKVIREMIRDEQKECYYKLPKLKSFVKRKSCTIL